MLALHIPLTFLYLLLLMVYRHCTNIEIHLFANAKNNLFLPAHPTNIHIFSKKWMSVRALMLIYLYNIKILCDTVRHCTLYTQVRKYSVHKRDNHKEYILRTYWIFLVKHVRAVHRASEQHTIFVRIAEKIERQTAFVLWCIHYSIKHSPIYTDTYTKFEAFIYLLLIFFIFVVYYCSMCTFW